MDNFSENMCHLAVVRILETIVIQAFSASAGLQAYLLRHGGEINPMMVNTNLTSSRYLEFKTRFW